MGNGIEGLIKKHYENAEDGSFESLMCAFALDMYDVKRDVKSLKTAKESFFARVGAIRATVYIFGFMLFNAIVMTSAFLGILKSLGKI